MLQFLRKSIPKSIFRCYHYLLASIASVWYGRSSEKMVVVGITGTKGKSSALFFLSHILEEAGFRVGMAGTIEFQIASSHVINDTKMTMLGRFRLQRLLRQMVQAGCTYALIETTSQGIEQFRHIGINYDIVIFTNLTPEHIEAHGGFEHYKTAKGKLFSRLAVSPRKSWKNLIGVHPSGLASSDGMIQKTAVVNMDDPHAGYFLSFGNYQKLGYTMQAIGGEPSFDKTHDSVQYLKGQFDEAEQVLQIRNVRMHLRIFGRHNAYNALAAACVAQSQGISLSVIQRALESVRLIPGRLEFIENNQDIQVIVDYAHEPAGMLALYQTLAGLSHSRIIHVLGSAGGGRDKLKRPLLGEIAAKNSNIVIITNEDPYDEDPLLIMKEVADGAIAAGKILDKDILIIADRRIAIAKALELARPQDLVLITGKGSEQGMMIKGGQMIPWDDRRVVNEELGRIGYLF